MHRVKSIWLAVFVAILLAGCTGTISTRGKAAPSPASCYGCEWFGFLQPTATHQPPERWGDITVTITDSQGRPRPNIRTYVYDVESKRPLALQFTDGKGRTVFSTHADRSQPLGIQSKPGPEYLPQFITLGKETNIRMELVSTGFDEKKITWIQPPEGRIPTDGWAGLPNRHILHVHDFTEYGRIGHEVNEYDESGVNIVTGRISPDASFVGTDYVLTMPETRNPDTASATSTPTFTVFWHQKEIPADRACVLFRLDEQGQTDGLTEWTQQSSATKSRSGCLDYFSQRIFERKGCGKAGTVHAIVALAEPGRAEKIRQPFQELTLEEFIYFYFCSNNDRYENPG